MISEVKPVNFKKILVNYTVCFLVLSIIVFSFYIFTGKTFVYNGDGKNQYVPVYIFWSKYLREFFHSIFVEHSFISKQWDFSIGEGADVLPQLSYNIVGDPFAFFSMFVSPKGMYIYYSVMSLFRLYVAGLAFSFMCFKTSHKSNAAILGGALSYVFFQYAIYNVTKHPHFLNILIYFPLMITGAEQIIKNKRPFLFISAVFLSAFTSFYFFYMAVILLIVYVIIRLYTVYSSDLKKIVKPVLVFLLYGLIGTGLAAVVLLPTLITVLHDSRQNMFGHIPLLYELKYYLYLPSVFFSVTGNIDGTHWLILAFPIPVILALYQLFSAQELTEETKVLKKLFVTCFVFVLFPIFGLIINGFQYPSNRWCWAFALLCSYILVSQWDNLHTFKLSRKALIVLILFVISALYNFSFILCSLIQCIILISLLLIQKKCKSEMNEAVYKRVILLAVCVSVCCTSIFVFSPLGYNFSNRALKGSDFGFLEDNEALRIKDIDSKSEDSKSFFRYSGRKLTSDIGMAEDVSSVQYYISLTNPKIQEFRESIEFNQAGDLHKYEGYDGRVVLDAISCVRYFYKPEDDSNPVPYGFAATSDPTIFKNEFSLPVAFTYSNFIFRNFWDSLSPLQKQEILLQSVVLEDSEWNNSVTSQHNRISTNKTPVFLSKEIAHTVTIGDGITKDGNFLEVLEPDSYIYVSFEGLEDSETYISLQNLHFSKLSEYDLAKKRNSQLSSAKKVKFLAKKILGLKKISSTPISFESSLGTSNLLDYKTSDYTWYANRHSFYVNMGYNKKSLSSVKITFAEPGIYSLDKLSVVCLPIDNYEKDISNLKENTIQNENITTNRITGQISVPSTKLLYFSVPYSNGWKAKVDGKFVPVLQANVMHMGIMIDKGTHDIELEYHTPFLRTGFIISIICFIVFIGIFIIQKHKND